MDDFKKEVITRIEGNGTNKKLKDSAGCFMLESIRSKYSYNFSWLGRPIIQYPQDIVAIQEIIWRIKPDLIIETGIAHGGSLIFSASMLALLEMSKDIEAGKVLGIDIDIRRHNKVEIEKHPLADKIKMIQGSSIDPGIIEEVRGFSKSYKNVMALS